LASGEPASTAAIQQLTEQAAASMTTPITLQPLDTEVSGFDAKTYFAAGMMVFFLFFVVQSGVLSLMAERESGTLTRLLAAPVSPASLILGKVLGSLVLGLASATVMVVATTLFIGAEWGDPLGVALLAVAGVLAAVGIVALIATFVTTEEQARSYSELAATFFGLLGGAFFPIGLATGIATQFSWASPHRWLLEGFRDLTAGDSAVDILPMVAVVLVFAVVTGAIGFLRSRKLVRLS
jgi:ABC-2 type transport system permease protein